jgi:hypothetical protein
VVEVVDAGTQNHPPPQGVPVRFRPSASDIWPPVAACLSQGTALVHTVAETWSPPKNAHPSRQPSVWMDGLKYPCDMARALLRALGHDVLVYAPFTVATPQSRRGGRPLDINDC